MMVVRLMVGLKMIGHLLDQGIQDLAQGNRLDQGIRDLAQGNHLDQEILVGIQDHDLGSLVSHHQVEMGKIDSKKGTSFILYSR